MSNNDNEVLEATNSDDTQDIEINLDDFTADTEEVKTDTDVRASQEFRQVLARAKKAEAELKALKGVKPAEAKAPQDTQEAIEKTVLKAQGLSTELLEQLEKIAKVTGKSIIEAQNDPIFQAIKKVKEEEDKSAKAKLGTSKGSASVKQEKSFNTPGLSEAEFKAMWKAKMGR